MQNITLLKPKFFLLRKDILSFILMYGILAPTVYYTFNIEFLYMKFFLVVLLFFNCLYYLTVETNDKYKANARFNESTNINETTHIKFQKQNRHHKIETDVIQINNERIRLNDGLLHRVIYFERQKMKYYWCKEEKKFYKVKPFYKQKVQNILDNKECIWENEIAYNLIEKNNLVFPLPNFKQIYKQQLMDPLNFFQLFSTALWFFDQDFYYPLMTLTLLLITNMTVCVQRIQTILNLRNLQTKPYFVSVQIDGQLKKKSSEDLIPGDIIVLKPSKQLQPAESKGKSKDDLIKEVKKLFPLGDKLPPQLLYRFMPKQEEQKEIVISSDVLILQGSVAVDESILTGENLPQFKNPIPNFLKQENFDFQKFKNHIVYAGTDIVSVTTTDDKPVLAMVMNTGFHTTKGKLARTVLYSKEGDGSDNKEAFFLLFILLIVSVISSVYVLIQGLKDEERNKDKLFIRCITIVTSVVPPELPMIMTMAINNSLTYLRKKRLFCTEPHRMKLAGKVDVCVFDKTGTLTQEHLHLQGVSVYSQNTLKMEKSVKNINMERFKEVAMILGGCQSIIELNKEMTGDPVELLFFQHSDFKFDFSNKKVFNQKDPNMNLTIRKTFYFSSELKRMSCIISAQKFDDQYKDFLVVKGAPEVIGNLLQEKPQQYQDWYRDLARKGYRLLSLAYRPLEKSEINCQDRDQVEKQLNFVGFLVLKNDLKNDTKRYIKEIKNSNREIVILTGDHLLTSISTYKSLGITNKESLIVKYQNNKIIFETLNNEKFENLKNLENYDLTISGEHLDDVLKTNQDIVYQLKVVARVNPKQKEIFVGKLKKKTKVLMCGDGTNDVGALKKADVGIALVGKKDEPTKELKEERKRKKQEAMKKAIQERRMLRPQDIQFDNEDLDFKLGDASIAAPFTNKHSNSIKCVLTILKQGLSTLTAGIQSYKTVTLTSLLSAYSLSFLHLENLKFSDYQHTLMGIYGAYLFFLLSTGRPVRKLPSEKPQKNIFNKYFWVSLLGQLFLQLVTLIGLISFAKKYAPDNQKDIDNEEEFVPTFINSCVFLYEIASMFCIQIFNFQGRPFMQSLSEYKTHVKFLLAPIGLLFILIFNVSEDISGLFQTTFKSKHSESENILFAIIFGFIGLSWVWTTAIKYWEHKKIQKWFQLILLLIIMSKRAFSAELTKTNRNLFIDGQIFNTQQKFFKKPKKNHKLKKSQRNTKNKKIKIITKHSNTSKLKFLTNFCNSKLQNSLHQKLEKVIALFGKTFQDSISYYQTKFCLSKIGLIKNLDDNMECQNNREEEKSNLIFDYLKNKQNLVKISKLEKFATLIHSLFFKEQKFSKKTKLQIGITQSILKQQKFYLKSSQISFENLRSKVDTQNMQSLQWLQQFQPKQKDSIQGNFLRRSVKSTNFLKKENLSTKNQNSIMINFDGQEELLNLNKYQNKMKSVEEFVQRHRLTPTRKRKLLKILQQRGLINDKNQFYYLNSFFCFCRYFIIQFFFSISYTIFFNVQSYILISSYIDELSLRNYYISEFKLKNSLKF